MLTMMFFYILMLISITFLFMSHPLAMGLSLLIQTLLVATTAGLMMPSFWFSYILFLVFLGGMLVLFIYVASLASNEMFQFSFTLFTASLLMTFVATLMIILIDPALINNFLLFISQENLITNTDLFYAFIFKMYNLLNYTLTLMVILYLLLALIIVANIVTIHEGPLRPMT